jgi:tripartite-type tricarboxylate transporter receptor subunit TctC
MIGPSILSRVRRAILTTTLATTLGLVVPTTAFAQGSYPAGPVRIVVPFPAGGPLDFLGRLLSDRLSVRLKQPFVIENRPGANGNIGTDSVAKAAADGQTLLLVLGSTLTVNPALYDRLPFDPEQDFQPISVLASYGQMLVVHPSLPVSSVPDFVAFAKEHADRPITYATGGGNGSPGHLTMEYFRAQAGFPMLQVPYKGAAPAVIDLIAGRVQSGFLITAGVLEHVNAGTLKAIAVSGAKREALAPSVPTVAEAGYPDFNADFYFLILVRRGTPDLITAVIEKEVRDALQSTDIQEKLRAQGLDPLASTGAEAAARLKADRARWARIIKDAGIKAD